MSRAYYMGDERVPERFYNRFTGQKAFVPNLLIVILDDIGAEYLPWSPAGVNNGALLMPNLAGLRNGIFTCYTMPACSQTRASLLTGELPRRHGIGEVMEDDTDPYVMSADMSSRLLDLKNEYGYTVGAFGKWHLVAANNRDAALIDPGIRGVDVFKGSVGNLPDYFSWEGIADGVYAAFTDYASMKQCEWALEFMNTAQEPWLCWLAADASHTPFHVPPVNTYTSSTATDTGKFLAAAESFDYYFGQMWDDVEPVRKSSTRVLAFGDNGSPSEISSPPAGTGKGTTGEWGTRSYVMDSMAPSATVVHPRTVCSPLDFRWRYSRLPLVIESFKPNGVPTGPPQPWKVAGIFEGFKYRHNVTAIGEVTDTWYTISDANLDETEISAGSVPASIKTAIESAVAL